MIFSEPFDQTCKTRIDLQDICRKNTVLFLELKCCLLCRVGKISAGMMFPLSFAVIQDQHRFLRCGFCLIGTKRCICALALCLIFVCRCCTEIKNWHVLYSSFSEKYLHSVYHGLEISTTADIIFYAFFVFVIFP